MKKTFLHISEEFEYTWLGKDNGMMPIYMSEKLSKRFGLRTNYIPFFLINC